MGNSHKLFYSFLVLLLVLPLTLQLSCSTVEPPESSNENDTTSHNFTWQNFEFGEHSSSVLYDVAIVGEEIWAVGEIYMNDSLGRLDPQPYNAVCWNRSNWTTKRIPTKTFSGTTVSSVIRAIYSFAENDIWTFSIAGSFSHWNGYEWETEFVNERDGSVNRLWGTGSNNLYLACNNGGISIYNGTHWQKLEKKTELDIYDILGQKTGNGGYEIICVAAKPGINNNKKIYKIENDALVELPSAGIPSSIKALWFKQDNKYYVVGSGIFTKQNISSNFGWEPIWQGLTEYYTGSIDGNDTNDIIICGAYGEMLHYNGSTWRSYREEIGRQTASYGRVKIEGDLVVAVGQDHPKALITIGYR